MTVPWSDIAALILVRLEWAILMYFVLVSSVYAVLLLSAGWEMLWYARQVPGGGPLAPAQLAGGTAYQHTGPGL